MRELVFAVLSIVTVSGSAAAANTQALAPATALENQTLTSTVRKKPDFVATTAAKMSFALFGAMAAVGEGNKIVASNGIDDPADAIAAGISRALASKHGAQVASAPITVSDDNEKQIAAAASGKARFVVDVKTGNWGFIYFPTDWTHYKILYNARARLIDVESNKVIAEGACTKEDEPKSTAPTYDQLMANGAALLKQALARAAGACVRSLNKEMFALDTDPEAPDAQPQAVVAANQPAAPSVGQDESLAASADAEQWGGVMSCGALQITGGQNPAPYSAMYAVEVRGNAVKVQRKTERVLETMSGKFEGNSLHLRGSGHWLEAPSRPWQLVVDGEFLPGATTFTGKGKVLANGRTLRDCELKMTRNARRET